MEPQEGCKKKTSSTKKTRLVNRTSGFSKKLLAGGLAKQTWLADAPLRNYAQKGVEIATTTGTSTLRVFGGG